MIAKQIVEKFTTLPLRRNKQVQNAHLSSINPAFYFGASVPASWLFAALCLRNLFLPCFDCLGHIFQQLVNESCHYSGRV